MSGDKVLLGADASPASARAAQWAAKYAGQVGAEVVAAHVLTYSQEFVRDLPPTGLTNWRQRLRDQLQGSWTEALRKQSVDCRCVLIEDETVDAGLLRLADQEAVDLIVLGANGRRDLHRLLGAVTYKVSHRANHPVVIVPADWTGSEDV